MFHSEYSLTCKSNLNITITKTRMITILSSLNKLYLHTTKPTNCANVIVTLMKCNIIDLSCKRGSKKYITYIKEVGLQPDGFITDQYIFPTYC